ncbi:hypothetical protein BB159_10725 [Streptococcus agalactiae]|nr:hypothetical protein BB159_10725 [Streptococcus agalactiae]
MMFIYFVLGFVVPSSSGLAVLSMPILAPTGLVMTTLQMLDMKYSHWLKFVWPVVLFLLIFGGGLLVLQVLIL